MNLKHLTDKVLLADTKQLAKSERSISLKILHHLKEIERRRLFADLGHGSLFDYCVRELGYSEPSASRRIHASRLLVEFPELEKKVIEGDITVTNMALAALTFKNEKIEDKNVKLEILQKVENTSKRECEKTLLEFSSPTPPPKEKSKVVSTSLVSVTLNLESATYERLQQLKGHLAHKRYSQDQVIRFALDAGMEKIEKDKFKSNAKFSTPGAKPCTNRQIPNIVKKQVFDRDKGKCTNCKSTYKLEYDHIQPFAFGGMSTVENLRLLCFSCNQRRNKL